MDLSKKMFLTNADICEILNCSSSKASYIRKQIKKKVESEGKKLLTNDVPTKRFLEFMCLDDKEIEFLTGTSPIKVSNDNKIFKFNR